MCGIAGVYLKPSRDDVESMLNKLAHRGPDGRGIKNIPNGTLGHTRLAVLDIQGGHQPMGIEDTWITLDGEIYNYRELAVEYLSGISLRLIVIQKLSCISTENSARVVQNYWTVCLLLPFWIARGFL